MPQSRMQSPTQFNFMPPTSRGRKARLRRVTFDVFAQFLRQHTMSVLLNL